MYYRRKILLSLIQLSGGSIEKIALQKLLLLFAKRQAIPAFEFVPYKYGCYSFSANADLTVMARKGMLVESDTSFGKNDPGDYVRQLHPEDAQLLCSVVSEYGGLDADTLMHRTYIQYPYYATRSEAAARLLSKEEMEVVQSEKTASHETILFTIGYEGISLEEYLNRLLRHDVRVLVDVRNNPLSMKYGFSKNRLRHYCTSLGIEYMHLPEVGIRSDQRQELNTQSDYDKLFARYQAENLTQTIGVQKQILDLLQRQKRIALTCFEANIHQCHRKHLAEAIAHIGEFRYTVQHI
jgi:hypothetical protein